MRLNNRVNQLSPSFLEHFVIFPLTLVYDVVQLLSVLHISQCLLDLILGNMMAKLKILLCFECLMPYSFDPPPQRVYSLQLGKDKLS